MSPRRLRMLTTATNNKRICEYNEVTKPLSSFLPCARSCFRILILILFSFSSHASASPLASSSSHHHHHIIITNERARPVLVLQDDGHIATTANTTTDSTKLQSEACGFKLSGNLEMNESEVRIVPKLHAFQPVLHGKSCECF